jgi:acyl-[acyl-carrier-protein]-phospholipid O-acyltransferase/long-chain-fatty-acid--[acyl-carrier-protein] ligase
MDGFAKRERVSDFRGSAVLVCQARTHQVARIFHRHACELKSGGMSVLNAVIAVIAAALIASAISAWRVRVRLGLTYGQASRHVLFRFIFGMRLRGLEHVRESPGPLLYIISRQSRLDRLLLSTYLPIGTFHVLLDGNPDYIFSVLKSALEGRARACLYIPKEVEASAETMARLERVGALAKHTGARVLPICIRGTRHSILSLWPREKAPRSLLPQIIFNVGPPVFLPDGINKRLDDALLDGVMLARFRSTNLTQTLFEALALAARVNGPGRVIVEDAVGGRLSYRQLMIGARVLAVRFAAMSRRGEAIGVLLPNSGGAVLTTIALMSAGRVPAMLNYTAGSAAVIAAIEAADIGTIVSSRVFADKADLQELLLRVRAAGTRIVFLEDTRTQITTREKLLALLLWRRAVQPVGADDPAAILFTSGSEGAPKGVVLSSRNLIANAAQADCRVDISPADCLFNVLPLFHSFGLLGGMLLPLLYGVRLYLYPSPRHYKLIPASVRKLKPTIMFGTDTFLAGYGRAAHDGDFASVRMIVAGAEPVRAATRTLFMKRFGTRIIEGYGLTEASPVVAVNSSTFFRDGTVGRLLPGMQMRIEPVSDMPDGGRLLLAGPNVMLGYLSPDRPGQIQPMAGKWHDTGDLVAVDERGFITIKGRARRFAKIAGEMISLGAVEVMVQQLWPDAEHAAIALPDARRGERIVLITTQTEPVDRHELIAHARRLGAAELLLPDEIIRVDVLPLLGSGKTDYPAIAELARERLSA